MKFAIIRQTGIVGLFWCGATKSLSLNLTEHFGLVLGFKFTEEQETKQTEALMDMLKERERLQALSNRELVTAALHAQNTDMPVINEMMDRLDPGWYLREDEGDSRLQILERRSA